MTTLYQILADTDIIWTPFRRTDRELSTAAAGIAERRERYQRRGVPFIIGGDSARRMAGSRLLADLRSAGHLKLYGTGRDRCVRLTPRGEALARSATACHVLSDPEPWALLERIAATKQTNAGHVLEVDLIDSDYSAEGIGPKLNMLEIVALPMLTAGWITSASDTQGRIGYGITTEGRTALKAGPFDLGDLPGMDDDACELYDQRLAAGLADRLQWKPERNHVAIPLGAGSWPRRTNELSPDAPRSEILSGSTPPAEGPANG